MSERPPELQQPVDKGYAFHALKPGDAWGESIMKERADTLEARLQEWDAQTEHGERRGPCYKEVRSGAGSREVLADVATARQIHAHVARSRGRLDLEDAFLSYAPLA